MHCTVITTTYTLLCIGNKAMVVGSQEGKYRSHLELHAPAMGELLFFLEFDYLILFFGGRMIPCSSLWIILGGKKCLL